MQQVLGATTKVIVDQKGGQNLLYLPIDKIMQLATQNSPQQPLTIESTRIAPPDVTTPPVVQDSLPSRRDSLRSRDREAGR
jgi:membrane protease subunit HflK